MRTRFACRPRAPGPALWPMGMGGHAAGAVASNVVTKNHRPAACRGQMPLEAVVSRAHESVVAGRRHGATKLGNWIDHRCRATGRVEMLQSSWVGEQQGLPVAAEVRFKVSHAIIRFLESLRRTEAPFGG